MSGDISKLDKNFMANDKKFPDMVLMDVWDDPICLYGLCKSEEKGVFTRLPLSFKQSDEVTEPLKHLMQNTAGVRMRFKTDSPYIALYALLGESRYKLAHMADTGAFGFDMYARDEGFTGEEEFVKTFIPWLREDKSFSDSYEFPDARMREITINFPLYHDVDKVYIGIKEDAAICAPRPYTVEKPVVFYGSSITQGACASRPGNCYTNILARRLDCDIVNLGFSGSAKGEKCIGDYIAGLEMSAFVMDYDYNCSGPGHLKETHYPLYETIRKAHPFIPIVMMSAPILVPKRYPVSDALIERRMVVMQSYIKGMKSGDKNLYFVDGTSLLGADQNGNGTVDGAHPTDYGFRMMANSIYPILEKTIR